MYMIIPNTCNPYFCAVFLVEMKQSWYLNVKVATLEHMLRAFTELYANYAKCDKLNIYFLEVERIPSMMNVTSCLHVLIARIHLNLLPSLFSFQTIKSMRPLSSSCCRSSVGEVLQHSLQCPRKLKRKICQQAVISHGSLQNVT